MRPIILNPRELDYNEQQNVISSASRSNPLNSIMTGVGTEEPVFESHVKIMDESGMKKESVR
jgi:hypothetical protein